MDTVVIDEEEINRIVRSYSDMLLRIAIQYVRSKETAEDCVQDCFLKLIKKKAFKSEEHLKAWLIRVTINRCKDELKSSFNQKVSRLDEDYASPLTKEDSLMAELNRLSPLEQNIIYLYYYEKYKLKEIAKIYKKTENAVTIMLSRARQKLKEFILEEENE